jgi:hypothetical protein
MDSLTTSSTITRKLIHDIWECTDDRTYKYQVDNQAGVWMVLPDLDLGCVGASWAFGVFLLEVGFGGTLFFFRILLWPLFEALATSSACFWAPFTSLSAILWAFLKASAALRAFRVIAFSLRLLWTACCFWTFANALSWTLVSLFAFSCTFSCSCLPWFLCPNELQPCSDFNQC